MVLRPTIVNFPNSPIVSSLIQKGSTRLNGISSRICWRLRKPWTVHKKHSCWNYI